MLKKDFIKIVNEEISKFDFLGNDEMLKEQEVTDLLINEDLQKQFICDTLLNKNDKVRIAEIIDSYVGGNWDDNVDASYLTLEYSIKIEYRYDSQREPIVFDLYFDAPKIDIKVDGWYDSGRLGGTTDTDYAPEGESWYDSFDWGDIVVKLTTVDGDEVGFKAFENAPPNIQLLFIRHYVENYVETNTLELRTGEKNISQNTIGYC